MKLAVFYHAKLSGPGVPSEDQAMAIYTEQLAALGASGLAEAASEIHFGLPAHDALLGSALAPEGTQVHPLAGDVPSEFPTLKVLYEWLPGHEDWLVCYHHIKGLSWPRDHCARWRRCMTNAVIGNWMECTKALENGYDLAGAHWVTPERYGWIVGNTQRYFGGSFWWARGSYLRELPPLPSPQLGMKYYGGEVWIGQSKHRPKVRDLAPHWPMSLC